MQVRRPVPIWIITLLVCLSRLPFIFTGYGAEEDAWGLRVTAENISSKGVYEVSRLPGHPLQELIYSQLWQYGPLAFNFLTLIISTAGIIFFMLSLKKLNIAAYVEAGIALAFIPVIYINSMNAMDYTWALSFVLIAFYFLVSNRMIMAGVFLGLAIGCRITSGAMIIPFIYYCYDNRNFQESMKKVMPLGFFTFFIACFLFLPVYNIYGFDFFRYYEHFAIPPFLKNLFKGTIGVWGLIGSIAVVAGLTKVILNLKKKYADSGIQIFNNRLFIFSLVVIVLYAIAFWRLPLKSAFVIPLVPFVILLMAQNLSGQWMKWIATAMIISSFFFGINLSDSNRGSAESNLAYNMHIAGQEVSIDPLMGPVIADYTKQQKLIEFSREVIARTKLLNEPSLIISGWYLNFIQVLSEKTDDMHEYVYYLDEQTIAEYSAKGFHIYYLPLQNQFNDLRFKSSFTDKYGKPLMSAMDDQKQ